MNWKKFFLEEEKDDKNIKIEFYSENKEQENNKSKVNKLKTFFTENDSYEEENEDKIEQNSEKNKKENFKTEYYEYKNETFAQKIVNLFRSNDDKNNYANTNEDNNSKENQKLTKTNNYNKLDIDSSEIIEEDYNFEEEIETKNKKFSFGNIKEKFQKIIDYGTKETDDKDVLFDENDDEINEVETNYEKSNFKNKITKLFNSKKDTTEDDDFSTEENYNNIDDNISEQLEQLEEKTILDEEKENITIKEQLTSLGIKTEEIKDVNIFEERENKRTHPTLASMKVKRILQDQSIDNLTTKLVFEDDKEKFTQELLKNDADINVTEIENTKNVRESKNKEERENLQQNFNKIARKNEQISDNKNYLKDKENSNIEKIISEIDNIEKNTNNKQQNIEISKDINSEKQRREKLSYTSVDDVLKDNSELLQNDIDKFSNEFTSKENDIIPPEEIEKLRENILIEKNEKNEKNKENNINIDTNRNTVLDKLLLDTKIKKEDVDATSIELNKLEENLNIIKNNEINNKVATQEISIEQVAKESEPVYTDYDEIKQEPKENKILSYSDYNLDLEEIEELKTINKIESESEKATIQTISKNIENINKQQNNDIDKFKEEKTYTPTKKIIEEEKEETKNNKIEYIEKLYSNDVNPYFKNDNSPLTFGEYKTQDYGYRPVSKETIENNQKKLNAIFEKYSTNSAFKNKTNKDTYINQKITTPNIRSIGKFKPTPVYSSVYGSNINKNVEKTQKNEKKINTTIIKNNIDNKLENKKTQNLFKEIASQNETVWNIEINSKIPKKKKRKD